MGGMVRMWVFRRGRGLPYSIIYMGLWLLKRSQYEFVVMFITNNEANGLASGRHR